ncbi:hypothetical protein QF117_02140 [Vibrio sp. YMD68]|uniref:hypothetical protein n=1 Tax=Vibrio sp. YMD68 TaxID=3042300 RepID=UPI00249C0BDC|nr:hypothetical protein [Vibrio sp. YMD68]WGV98785.1 hypothetical protein QF117_02140 [Vibrio sp. YMD68]
MADHNIGQILQAFNSIESQIREQHKMIKELTSKVSSLEAQNKTMAQLIHQLQNPSPQPTLFDHDRNEFQVKVMQSLSAIENKSKKTIELIKANSASTKKRAWP